MSSQTPPSTTDNTPASNPDDLVIPSFTVPPHPSEGKKERSPCCRRIICISISLGIIAAGAIGIMFALTGDAPQAIFIQEDPPGLEETNRWTASKGRGLEVFVMNSCEDRWTPIFDEYIAAWDNGSPDALTISTRKFPHDPECAEATGRINVCNGNYGNTAWRGVNTAFLRGGFVQHSVAKLNDYHLDRESQNQKRYTMCHELGHAFGLPHTDVNYYNFDRGDCLDYTIRPGNNLSPGEFNFNLLYTLYGSVNGDPSTSAAGEQASGTRPQNQARPRPNENEEEEEDEDDRRRRLGAPPVDDADEEAPEEIMQKYAAVRACLEEMSCNECLDQAFLDYDGTGRIIHDDTQGEACEFDLGDGYTVQTHKLLVI